MTTQGVNARAVMLSVGDTTYLDYASILEKRDGDGPQGNGGNGLLLHSALAIDPEHGQPLGLLWQKLWNREHRTQGVVPHPDEIRSLGLKPLSYVAFIYSFGIFKIIF